MALNYISINKIKNSQIGGVAWYVHNNLDFEIPKRKKRALTAMMSNVHVSKLLEKNTMNIIVFCIYQPPRGDSYKFFDEIKTLICKNHQKKIFLVADHNINSFNYGINTNVCDCFSLVFENSLHSHKYAYKSNKIKSNNSWSCAN